MKRVANKARTEVIALQDKDSLNHISQPVKGSSFWDVDRLQILALTSMTLILNCYDLDSPWVSASHISLPSMTGTRPELPLFLFSKLPEPLHPQDSTALRV